MTRKNFEAIAKAIRDANECDDKDEFVAVLLMELLRHFSEVNANFDADKFIKATGV